MKFSRFIVLIVGIVLICLPSPSFSQEFSWVDEFNKQANQDVDAFKGLLAERFNKRIEQINTVFQEFQKPADAYMAFKLGEMSKRPVSDVVDAYGKGKSKGWGALAKSLGIKPGSKEFHELKQQDDLYHGNYSTPCSKKKNKEKRKGKKSK